jgi:hypothetical protein
MGTEEKETGFLDMSWGEDVKPTKTSSGWLEDE